MKGERILSIGMFGINHDVIYRIVGEHPEDDHEIVGTANSFSAISSLVTREESETPTVAVLTEYADPAENSKAVAELNRVYPGIKIIGLGVGKDLPVNKRLEMPYTSHQIREALLEI